MRPLMTIVLLLGSAPALAQSWELTPLVGYTSAAPITRTADGVEDITLDRGVTVGVQTAYFFSPHIGLEAQWTHQTTKLSMTTATGSPDLLTTWTEEVGGNLVYQFGAAARPLRPFVFGGVGITSFSAPDVAAQTKFSWTVGAGVKWFPEPVLGVEVRGRYKPTELQDSSSTFCNPFGFCQSTLNRFELGGGVVVRF